MNIIETEIPDISIDNIDQTKVQLAEKIIQNINPLFNDLQQEKKLEFNTKVKEYNNLKETVISNKKQIEILFDNYKRKQKIKKLLERVDKLVSLGLVKEGSSKQETIVLLKVIDKLPIEKLDFHLKDTLNTLNKRFPV